MRDDGFNELRKSLAYCQELLEKASPGITENYVEPVVGQETPMDALVLIRGYGTIRRVQLRDEICKRLTLNGTINSDWFLNTYRSVYASGVLKAMMETEILHQGKEL